MIHTYFVVLCRNESSDLLHERNVVGHRVSGIGERHLSQIDTHVPRLETNQREAACEAASAESPVSETRLDELDAAGRRGGLLRATGQAADRGADGPGPGQGNGAHADGSGEAEAEAESHHRDSAMQLGKSQ